MSLSMENLKSDIKKAQIEHNFSNMPELTRADVRAKIAAMRQKITELQAERVNAENMRRTEAIAGFTKEVQFLENEVRRLEEKLHRMGIE